MSIFVWPRTQTRETQAGLFLATTVTFITITFQDLTQDPQDVSAFYLKNIYQLLATLDSNSLTSIPPTLAEPPAFTPPRYALYVNSLFLLSGVLSAAAALSAILRQQWAKRYIMATQQPSHTPHQRARIRAIFVVDTKGPDIMPGSGVAALYLPLSVILFFVGGLIYLLNINRFVLAVLATSVVPTLITYTKLTVKPIFTPNTLCYGPFSPFVFRLYLGTLYASFKVCSWIAPLHGLCIGTRKRYYDLRDSYREGFFSGKQKAAEDMIPSWSTKLDADILESALQSCLGEDDELEKFFKAIPGFFDSKVVKNLKEELPDVFRTKFCHALHKFLDRAFSSNSIPESERSHRVLICLNAARAALSLDQVSRVLDDIFSARGQGPHGAPQSVEAGNSEGRLADYDGDSASLAILIHITHQLCRSDFPSWGPDVLRQLPYFDIRNTLPGLQQDFRALWDTIVQESRKRGDGSNPNLILREIHHFYIALQGTDAAPAACSDPISNDDNIPFVPSCGSVDHGTDSNSLFPMLNPGPTCARILPAAEPTSNGAPISASSHHAPLEVQGLVTLPGVVASAGAPQSNVDISAVSGLTNPILFSPSGCGATLQGVNKAETITPSIVLGSPSIPVPTSVVSRDIISAAPPHPSIDSAVSRTAHTQHTLGPTSTSASASAAVLFPISPRVLDQHATRTTGTASTHDDSYHQNPPIHLDDFHHTLAAQSAESVTDMVQVPWDARTANMA